jgi:hypothetical protein
MAIIEITFLGQIIAVPVRSCYSNPMQEQRAPARGFEHHAALNYSPRSAVLSEALTKYMGRKIHHHNGEDRTLFENW